MVYLDSQYLKKIGVPFRVVQVRVVLFVNYVGGSRSYSQKNHGS